MLPVLLLAVAALGAAVLRLLSYRSQLLAMAHILEETPVESNLCLTVQMSGAPARRLCQAVNARLEAGRQLPRHPHPPGRGHGLFAAAGGGTGAQG